MSNEDDIEPKTFRHDGCYDRFTKFPPKVKEYESKADLPPHIREANLKNGVIASKTKIDENPYGYLVNVTFIQVEAGCKAGDDALVGANAIAKIRVS